VLRREVWRNEEERMKGRKEKQVKKAQRGE
jgi:hypothetical protein